MKIKIFDIQRLYEKQESLDNFLLNKKIKIIEIKQSIYDWIERGNYDSWKRQGLIISIFYEEIE